MLCIFLIVMVLLTSNFSALKPFLSGRLGGFASYREMSMNKAALFSGSSPANVLVPVAHGSEEIETVTIVDTLVRGGAKVTLAAVSSPSVQVSCSRGVNLVADKFLSDCTEEEWDLIVCPGGAGGAQKFRDCRRLHDLLAKQHSDGKLVAAICAAPAVVLSPIVKDRQLTCYPSEKFIKMIGKDRHSHETTLVDGNVITSQGPGTAMEFSLRLVEILFGEEVAERVKREMIVGSA